MASCSMAVLKSIKGAIGVTCGASFPISRPRWVPSESPAPLVLFGPVFHSSLSMHPPQSVLLHLHFFSSTWARTSVRPHVDTHFLLRATGFSRSCATLLAPRRVALLWVCSASPRCSSMRSFIHVPLCPPGLLLSFIVFGFHVSISRCHRFRFQFRTSVTSLSTVVCCVFSFLSFSSSPYFLVRPF